MSKRTVSILLAVLMVFSMAASLAEGTAVTVTDMRGREITLTEPVTRVVVMHRVRRHHCRPRAVRRLPGFRAGSSGGEVRRGDQH